MDAAPTGMKKGERGMATAVPLGLAAAARTWERRGDRAWGKRDEYIEYGECGDV